MVRNMGEPASKTLFLTLERDDERSYNPPHRDWPKLLKSGAAI
jgi:hypothetical protein